MECHFRLGPWLVQPSLNTTVRNGKTSHLTPKAMEVLVCLSRHPGEPVAKEELLQTVWPDTFVGDDVLKGSIAELRRVFQDDAKDPRIIQTIAKRGYRLIAPVEWVDGKPHAASVEQLKQETARVQYARSHTLLIAGSVFAAAAVLVAVLGVSDIGGLRTRFGHSATPQIHSLAVLPLRNLSADPTQEYFSDGMTDALITELAQINSVKVISRTSTMQYRDAKKPLPEIARELNVDGIIEGTVQRSGDRVRITAQLIYGPSDKHIWASSYERDLRDVFALERNVADDIAHQVQARLNTQKQAAEPHPVNLQALEAYLQGNSYLDKGLNLGPRDENLRKATKYFQQAVQADAAFAPAYIGLAEAHRNFWWPSSEDLAMMKVFALKAVELAPSSADALVELGDAKWEDRDWVGAEEEYRRAIALDPNSVLAHHSLGLVSDALGEIDAGWKEYEIAQQLDPNQDHLSDALRRRGQFSRAIELLRKMAERRPEDAAIRWFLSENYLRSGQYKEWVEELGESMASFGFPEIQHSVRRAFDESGYQGALRQWAHELERLSVNRDGYFPGLIAETYAALGDKNRAFYWLREGCEHRQMTASDPVLQWVKVDHGIAPLRTDPRFKDVLRCMGLPP